MLDEDEEQVLPSLEDLGVEGRTMLHEDVQSKRI